MEAPEKLFINKGDAILGIYSVKESDAEIKYTRTDAFIEKAWSYIKDNLLSLSQQYKSHLYYEQFRNYMEGE